MLQPGEVFENPRTGARIEVLRREGDELEFQRVYPPRTGKAGPHKHLDFVQSFEVLDGEMRMRLGREERVARPGESVEVPLGTMHVDPWNESDTTLRVRARFQPVPDFAEAFARALGHHWREGTVNDQGEFPQLQLFVLLHEYRAQSFGPGPVWLQKPVIPLLAAIGRLRGYGVQA